MKKAVLLFIAFLSILNVEAQPYKYWIEFTDKNGSPYTIGNPSAYLSARAIARRTKYGIPVKLNDLPPNPNYVDSVIAKGVKLLNRSRWFNAISIYAADTTKLASIRALSFVKHGTLVTIVGRKKIVSNSNNYARARSGFREGIDAQSRISVVDTFNSGSAYNQEHMIGVDCINNMGFRGKGYQIAQIDARFGVANTLPAFDSLYNRGGVLGTWDFVWEDPNVYDDTNNTDNHGQMVLGCMVGNLPGSYMGDAADADFYLLRTEDVASEHRLEDDNWTSGAEYADSAGADVITSSLGYTTFDEGFDSYTYADMNGRVAVASQAATIASEKGLVVCVAAGNLGGSGWQYISSPGDADSILTVGAVDASGNYAFFSSTGPTSDHRVKPDVAAQGLNSALISPGGGVGTGSGTSFATPIMAGAVASLWSANPTVSNFELMSAVKQSASQYATPDSLEGYGIPNFCIANVLLHSLSSPTQTPVTILNKVYPNPFNNSVTVEFYSSLKQEVTVSLFNSIGQTVYKKSLTVAANGNTLIDIDGLSGLPQGVYLVTVADATGMMYTSKIVK
ncbi:MAG TPA: S8/S53 family peptidase [Bacteroidia bacterium]|nr:S8/S53 family peptidase [Bacteroidia bacterium]